MNAPIYDFYRKEMKKQGMVPLYHANLPRRRLIEKHLCDECDDRFTCSAKEDCDIYKDFLTTDFSSAAVTEIMIGIKDYLIPPEYEFDTNDEGDTIEVEIRGWRLNLDGEKKVFIYYFKEDDYKLQIEFEPTTQRLKWYTEKVRERSEKGEYPYYTDVIKGKIYVLRLDSGYWWSKDDENGWLEIFHETLKLIKQEKPSGIIIQDNSMPEWNMAEETHFSINEWLKSKNEN